MSDPTAWRPTSYLSGEEVWRLHATHGLPLEMSIPLLADRGTMVIWLDLLTAAEKDGANRTRLIERLRDIVHDAYPRVVAAGICRGLDLVA